VERTRPVFKKLGLQVRLFPVEPEGKRPYWRAVATCSLDALAGAFSFQPLPRGERPLFLCRGKISNCALLSGAISTGKRMVVCSSPSVTKCPTNCICPGRHLNQIESRLRISCLCLQNVSRPWSIRVAWRGRERTAELVVPLWIQTLGPKSRALSN